LDSLTWTKGLRLSVQSQRMHSAPVILDSLTWTKGLRLHLLLSHSMHCSDWIHWPERRDYDFCGEAYQFPPQVRQIGFIDLNEGITTWSAPAGSRRGHRWLDSLTWTKGLRRTRPWIMTALRSELDSLTWTKGLRPTLFVPKKKARGSVIGFIDLNEGITTSGMIPFFILLPSRIGFIDLNEGITTIGWVL